MKTIAIAGSVLALALAGSATGKVPSEPTPADIVATRQAAMMMSAASLNGIKNIAEKADSVKAASFSARGIAAWAKVLPAMFAANTAKEPGSRAKPEVWSNRADFEAKALNYSVAAQAMVAAAQADDKAALGAAVGDTAKACKACHDAYQAAPPPKPPADPSEESK